MRQDVPAFHDGLPFHAGLTNFLTDCLCRAAPGDTPVPWQQAVVRLDVLAYVQKGATSAEAAAEVLQPAIRTQLQVRSSHLLSEICGCKAASQSSVLARQRDGPRGAVTRLYVCT